MHSSTMRLFIALWPSDAVRAEISRWQSEWQWPERASVVAPERMHITLHFLGDMPSQRVLDLKYVLKDVPTPRFDLHFGRPDIWQHGLAVLRPNNSPTALRGLQARIGLALAGIAMTAENRAYRPHVTLARRASAAKPPERVLDTLWQAKNGFVLARSPGGEQPYEILERFGA